LLELSNMELSQQREKDHLTLSLSLKMSIKMERDQELS